MRDCGEDLNVRMDSYQDLFMPVSKLRTQQDLGSSASSGYTFIHKVPQSVFFEDCELKSLSNILTTISERSRYPADSLESQKYQANIQLIKAESRIIRIINELQELYNADPNEVEEPESQSSLLDKYATRTTLRIRTATSALRCQAETDDSKLMSYYDAVKENLPNNCQQEVPPLDVKFNDMLELMVKYNDYIKLERLRTSCKKERISRSSPVRSNRSNLAQLKATAECIARNKKILDELRNYTKAGKLRPQLKPLRGEQSWTKAILNGAYRALQRYTRSHSFWRIQGCLELFKIYREYAPIPSLTGDSLVIQPGHISK